jgi:hypothetical protein
MRFSLLHRSHMGCSLSHRTLRSLHISHVVLLDLDACVRVLAFANLREAMKCMKYCSLLESYMYLDVTKETTYRYFGREELTRGNVIYAYWENSRQPPIQQLTIAVYIPYLAPRCCRGSCLSVERILQGKCYLITVGNNELNDTSTFWKIKNQHVTP